MLLHETQADSWVVKLFLMASQPMKQDMMLSSVIIILKPGHIETNKLENSGRFGQANSYRFIHIIKCQCQFMSKRSIYITKRWPITMHVQIISYIITLKQKLHLSRSHVQINIWVMRAYSDHHNHQNCVTSFEEWEQCGRWCNFGNKARGRIK